MRATLMYGAGDVRVDNVPDSVLKLPTDALVRVTAACICGSDRPDEGGQSEAVRVPFADGTLVKVPGDPDPALTPSLVTLSDVFGTGYHAAVAGGVTVGSTVAVIGDGAVGLLVVLSAKMLGASHVVLMGIVRPGGVISRVGVPQYEEAPVGLGSLFLRNVRLTGAAAPTRALHRLPRTTPGAQLSLFEERDGWRYTAFVTSTQAGALRWIEARHRARAHARVQDRIRCAKDTGMRRPGRASWPSTRPGAPRSRLPPI